MPTFVGIKNSNFDPQAYARLTQDNSGPERITTEDILEGWRGIRDAALSEDFIALAKSSPMYISSQENQ